MVTALDGEYAIGHVSVKFEKREKGLDCMGTVLPTSFRLIQVSCKYLRYCLEQLRIDSCSVLDWLKAAHEVRPRNRLWMWRYKPTHTHLSKVRASALSTLADHTHSVVSLSNRKPIKIVVSFKTVQITVTMFKTHRNCSLSHFSHPSALYNVDIFESTHIYKISFRAEPSHQRRSSAHQRYSNACSVQSTRHPSPC